MLVPMWSELSHEEWTRRAGDLPLPLSETDVQRLRGTVEELDIAEVRASYLPLASWVMECGSRLGRPLVVGVTGSVAVGKSVLARLLEALLSRWSGHPRVALVTTDGFLYPNTVLAARGIAHRKGFPESYDMSALRQFLATVVAGKEARALTYSHLTYDIVPGEFVVVRRPDILVLEGLHVSRALLGEQLDCSIYVDASIADIRRWYVQRFLRLRRTAFTHPDSFFHRFAALTDDEARDTAVHIWSAINEPNLREHIEPTRELADLVLVKGPDHAVRRVRMRMREE
ncbi:MAG TPA: type I pantothenate kinase [Actinomycetes bacterium]|nr:type I pantothenate kinase [Actinomycetes bacterium]